ncbi:VOC family protein [Rhodobacterales bacterium HKCCE2091]|nr:VOC family protein [Rhodobacterales bacterium HKCCE2091]
MSQTETLARPETLPRNPVCWSEIPVTDLDAAAAFYGHVLNAALVEKDMGGTRTFVLPCDPGSVSMNLQTGKPAGDPGTGPVVYFSAPDIEAAAERVEAAGGRLLSPILSIPVGRVITCGDPDGNSFGLFAPHA